MKTATLTLKRKVLVIEFPKDSRDYKLFNDKEKPYVSYWQGIETKRFYLPEGSYTLLGSPDELKEEDVAELIEKRIGIGYVFGNTTHSKAIDAFNSALESHIYWNINPLGDYLVAHKRHIVNGSWHEAESRTFDRTRTLIFVEN